MFNLGCYVFCCKNNIEEKSSNSNISEKFSFWLKITIRNRPEYLYFLHTFYIFGHFTLAKIILNKMPVLSKTLSLGLPNN